jgi:hypothetical protein
MDIIEQYMQASKKLIHDGFYRQSINLSWIALRLAIFKWLKYKDIPYESSRDAFLKIIQYFPQESISTNICFLDTISTLCEWDENFNINLSSAKCFYVMCHSIIKQL